MKKFLYLILTIIFSLFSSLMIYFYLINVWRGPDTLPSQLNEKIGYFIGHYVGSFLVVAFVVWLTWLFFKGYRQARKDSVQ